MSNYHISKDGAHWKAQKEGASRASVTGATKAEVHAAAAKLAINSGGGEVREHASRTGTVHKAGQIIDSDTYGKPDPRGNG